MPSSINHRRHSISKSSSSPPRWESFAPDKKNRCQNHGGRNPLCYGCQKKSNQISVHRFTNSVEVQSCISCLTCLLSPGPYPLETSSTEMEQCFLWHCVWKHLWTGYTGNHYKQGSHLLPLNPQSECQESTARLLNTLNMGKFQAMTMNLYLYRKHWVAILICCCCQQTLLEAGTTLHLQQLITRGF